MADLSPEAFAKMTEAERYEAYQKAASKAQAGSKPAEKSGSSFSFARTVGEAAPLVIIYQLAVAGKNNLAIAGAAESAKTIPVLIYEWTIKHLEMEQHIISSGGSYTVSSLQNTELFSSLSAAILVIFAIQGSLHLFGYWAARTSPTAP